MTNFHDPYRHLKYLRQSLSQDNEAIGFFISAGCPLAVEMPEKIDWPLIPDVATLTMEITEILKDDKKYTSLLEELGKSKKNIKNIEDILSFIRSLRVVATGGEVRGFTETDLVRLEKLVCGEIVKRLKVDLPQNETPYHRLCKWIGSIDRKIPIEIFTTNYDLLMEEALENQKVPYFDGFVGSKKSFFDLRAVEDDLIPTHWTRLWKLHGSINWHQDKNPNGKKVFRSSSTEDSETPLIYPSHLKYDESRKMPYLALIDRLNKFIRRKSSFLILAGYSFNDEHLNDAIVNALIANPTGMVLALQFGTYLKSEKEGGGERYPHAYSFAKDRHNLNVWTYDQAIIGTNPYDWKTISKGDDEERDIKEFVHSVKIEGRTIADTKEVRLGDFSEFTMFLKKLIGSDEEK